MEFLVELIDTFWDHIQSGTLPRGSDWSYLLLFILVIIEGPIVSLVGAAAASTGFLDLPLVFLTVILGNFVADLGWYYLGYFSKEHTLLKYGRWLGLRRRHLHRLRRGMRRHASKILLAAKFTAGFIIPTLVAAGLARVPFRQWFPIVFAGEVFWATLLVLIGYYAAEAIKRVQQGLHYLALGGFVIFVLVLVYLVHRALRPSRTLGIDDEVIDELTGGDKNGVIDEADASRGVSQATAPGGYIHPHNGDPAESHKQAE